MRFTAQTQQIHRSILNTYREREDLLSGNAPAQLRGFKEYKEVIMSENTLRQDDAIRTQDYEAMKSDIRADLADEIAGDSGRPTEARSDRIGRNSGGGRFVAFISQIVDYIFFVIYGLLAVRLMLALFAANESAGFVKMIKDVTDPLYQPFKGIVPSLSLQDGFTLVLPIIVALFVYVLLHLAINGLLRLFVQRKTVI